MYYVLNDLDNHDIDEDEDDSPFLEFHEELITNPPQGWHSGAILKEPPALPILIEATPHFGYQGAPPDYYDDAISLMSPRLKKTLEDTGVDNIHYYSAVVSYRKTGEKYDWYAFNIIGLISATDFDNSDVKNEDGTPLINSKINGFTVDISKPYSMEVFRLAENVMTTLVSARVRTAIKKHDINTFGFTKPENWIII